METDGTETHGRRGAPESGVDDLGGDDQEFTSVEDTGAAPPENPAVDDV